MQKSIFKINNIAILLGALMLSTPSLANDKNNTLSTDNTPTQKKEIDEATVIKTQYGLIKGKIDKINNVIVWTGIPYAKTPIGELRWKKPVDPDKWDGILNTTKASNVAFQLSENKIIGSDDCLNLNFYRPNNNR